MAFHHFHYIIGFSSIYIPLYSSSHLENFIEKGARINHDSCEIMMATQDQEKIAYFVRSTCILVSNEFPSLGYSLRILESQLDITDYATQYKMNYTLQMHAIIMSKSLKGQVKLMGNK